MTLKDISRIGTGAILTLGGIGGTIASAMVTNKTVMITALVAAALVISAGVIVIFTWKN